ncbi:hypothetical protein HAZT_HAZT009259 [Hyalella azteca]|uniref:Mutator-like transposase domain-containing protein n=1 Tax=Hyalella azteca TaxID=294128 RepID=A0A6A0GT91_HYAAZ|nr:hypothetical protein HAZT_HAZT009259 [Hyalella azteca]
MIAALKHASSERGTYKEGNEFLDLDVSFDGTWMTRGHKSHIGIGCVIEWNTGFVVDFEVLSNFCQSCFTKQRTLSPEEFAHWKVTHRNCKKNFDGKSGAMEKEAATRIWSRSTQLGLRYVTFLSDGDSAAYKAVTELNDGAGPYDVPVEKEECINHVSKISCTPTFSFIISFISF